MEYVRTQIYHCIRLDFAARFPDREPQLFIITTTNFKKTGLF